MLPVHRRTIPSREGFQRPFKQGLGVLCLALALQLRAESSPKAPAPAVPTAVAKASPSKPSEGGFSLLAGYPFSEDSLLEAKPREGIPAQVLALDGTEFELKGFMLPLRLEKGRAVEFLLLQDQNACCFGRMPRVNEWVLVKTPAGGVPVLMDIPVTCRGRFSVGGRFESGVLTGIYFMEQAKVSVEK